MHVCTVSIVPTRLRSLSSVTDAETRAEVRDDREAPHHPDHDDDPRRPTEREADHQCAGAADDERCDGDGGTTDAIGGPAAGEASQRAARDHQKRDDAGADRWGSAVAQRKAGGEEAADPRPHRVELPHVPEVAEICQAKRRTAEGVEGIGEAEGRCGAAVRSDLGPADQDRTEDCGSTCGEGGEPPVEPGGRKEMRRRRSQRHRSDEQPDEQAEVAFRPRRGDLHADGIDAGEAEAGCEPQEREWRCRSARTSAMSRLAIPAIAADVANRRRRS